MNEHRYLLDTSVVIWAVQDSKKQPRRFQTILDEVESFVISAVSVWEISIKQSIGRLDLPASYLDELHEAGAILLPVTARHALSIPQLPLHHRDPFDRMLIAQARVEALTLLTADRQFSMYDVPLG